MPGETNIHQLLQNMAPALMPGEYVFTTSPFRAPKEVPDAIGYFREAEGLTYILPRSTATRLDLSYEGTMAWITLQVHSSLHAVGLTAAVSAALAEAGISCNVVAAYYHDHLFVPFPDANRAMSILKKLGQAID